MSQRPLRLNVPEPGGRPAMCDRSWPSDLATPARIARRARQVLFTTFTRNLAGDIEQNLKTLCGASTLPKLEVRNLDAWVHGFMRAQKLEHRIVYDRKQDAALQAWQAAMAVKDTKLVLPDDFYEQELEQVILAQGITTPEEFRTARRIGRSGVLSRSKRDAVWPVFEEYRGQLASRKPTSVGVLGSSTSTTGPPTKSGDRQSPFLKVARSTTSTTATMRPSATSRSHAGLRRSSCRQRVWKRQLRRPSASSRRCGQRLPMAKRPRSASSHRGPRAPRRRARGGRV